MRRPLCSLIVVIAGLACIPSASGQVFTDSLNGSTTGTRSGGTFTGGGWRVDNQYDSIYWHTGTYAHGAFEYNAIGFNDSCPGGAGFKNELSHMYDFTWNNADNQYAPGYRDDPYKQYVRKQCESGKERTLELVWACPPDGNFIEPDTGALSWNSGNNYLFRTEWENIGGVAILKIFRDGIQVFQGQVNGSWNPAGSSIRIAASSRRADEGANTGIIYSNVKLWNLGSSSAPNAPTVTSPANGEIVNTTAVYVQWAGDSHTQYQLRVNTANDPNSSVAYDSQLVTSDLNYAWTGSLSNATYYVFVRLGNSSGLGAWSAMGRTFTVDTFFSPSGPNIVRVNGTTVRDNNGAFLGLGATYMRALQRCKYDRARFNSDCALLASKGFNYIRALTMVPWQGLEIAPVSFTNPSGTFIAAWSDYDQQVKDMIDIAFGYGLRTEVTIFAGADYVMPSDSTRMAHLDRILSDIAGRENKIIHLEVANEYWQNGFPDPGGVSDMRSKGQYLATRTTVPVALSSPSDTSTGGVINMYSGSAADIATVHFTRDISGAEDGWRPVWDCYPYAHLSGVVPVSSNEPIGAGSSVSTENDPLKLGGAAIFAFVANLPMYVYHSRAGVFGWTGCCPPSGTEVPFENTAGIDAYKFVRTILPPDVSSWVRNDGKETAAVFTSFSNGQANKWWPEVGGATNGCDRNIGTIKGGQFITFPMGILSGGLTLQARRPMSFEVYNYLNNTIAYTLTKQTGDTFTLAQGPGAYIIKGALLDVPGGTGSSTVVSVDLGNPDVSNGLTGVQGADGATTPATIGGRSCRQNANPPATNSFFYFAANDAYVYQGNKPTQYITLDYYDTGTTTLTLDYDSSTGTGIPAFYRDGGSVTLTNTNTWKQFTFVVADAYFGNRQNNSADFRIGGGGSTFYLDIVQVSIDPPPNYPTCYNEPFSYPNSNLVGNERWFGSAGSEIQVDSQSVKFNGGTTSRDAYRLVNCADPGTGTIRVAVKALRGIGEATMWNLWVDDTNGIQMIRWYGSGTSVRGRVGSTAIITPVQTLTGNWDDLVVLLNPVAKTADFYFNNAFVSTLNYTGQNAGTSVGRLRFEREPNSESLGHYVYLDDLRIRSDDATANVPGVASNPSPASGATGVSTTATLSWTAGANTLSHNIYFGSANPPPYLGNQSGTTYNPGLMATGTTYYWRINEVNASGTTTGPLWSFTTAGIPICFTENFTYPNSNLNGNDGWSGSAGSEILLTSQTVKITGGATGVDSYRLLSCADPGTGYIRVGVKVQAGVGVETSWALWIDDTSNVNMVRWYGASTNARGRVGGTGIVGPVQTLTGGWDDLVVKIKPATKTADFYFNGVAAGTLDYSSQGTSNTVGRLRFERIANAAITSTQFLNFDDLTIGAPDVPGQAGNPSPPTGATEVSTTATLSWTAGANAASHNVYFGSTNPPVARGNQTATTYNPGPTSPGTTYYWRIDEVNSSGTTTGQSWSFTTLPVPGAASAPNPANAATDVAANATLAWTTGSNAASHDVYFGTTNPPPFKQNKTGATYNPGPLDAGTIYYWRIDELNSSGITTGPSWSFTTLAPTCSGLALAPSPANGSIGNDPNNPMSWTPDPNSITQDVYFGTTNPPPFVVNVSSSASTYDPPGTLSYDALYYWRIDEVHPCGTVTGDVWSFTTAPPPALMATAWRSVRTHTTAGALAIALNPAAVGTGSSGPVPETRNGGVQLIEVDFNKPSIVLQDPVVSGSDSSFPAPTSSTMTPNGLTLQIVFNPGVLLNQVCYTIDLTGAIYTDDFVEEISGDTDCKVRNLIGDVNGNGQVSISDQLSTKAQTGLPVPPSIKWDVNLSGTITVSDQLLIKSKIPSSACP